MAKITGVISILLALVLISSCGKIEKHEEFQLPEKFEHHKLGKIVSITPRALVDSLKAEVNIDIYFIREAIPDNPAHIVSIPGMKEIQLSEMFYVAETLSTERPIYLICLWGDDSRRIAGRLAIDGITSYCLDGGSYRLWKEMQANGLELPKSNSKTDR
ncbi:hypothetical protein HQ587_09540 [bacterium]|nr:hypothetical protein [bacterium]